MPALTVRAVSGKTHRDCLEHIQVTSTKVGRITTQREAHARQLGPERLIRRGVREPGQRGPVTVCTHRHTVRSRARSEDCYTRRK